MKDKEHYISINRVEVLTGMSKIHLMNFALTTDSSIFFYYQSGGWANVPLFVIKKLYEQLKTRQCAKVKFHLFEKLTSDELYMRDEDIRKFILWQIEKKDDEDHQTTTGLTLPNNHECPPEGLITAMRCWKHFYEKVSVSDGKKIKKEQREKWIKDNFPNITKNFREEIAKVANPFPKGGAPKKN